MSHELKAFIYTIGFFISSFVFLYIYEHYPDVAVYLVSTLAFSLIFMITYVVIYWVWLGGPKR